LIAPSSALRSLAHRTLQGSLRPNEIAELRHRDASKREGRPIDRVKAAVHGLGTVRACDQLHAGSDIDDALWAQLRLTLSEMALVEVLMLAGFYRTVSYLTNSLRLPLLGKEPRDLARVN
jgi:hypothetical protein